MYIMQALKKKGGKGDYNDEEASMRRDDARS